MNNIMKYIILPININQYLPTNILIFIYPGPGRRAFYVNNYYISPKQ